MHLRAVDANAFGMQRVDGTYQTEKLPEVGERQTVQALPLISGAAIGISEREVVLASDRLGEVGGGFLIFGAGEIDLAAIIILNPAVARRSLVL